MRTESSRRKQASAKFAIAGVDGMRALIAAAGFAGLCVVVFFAGMGARLLSSASPPPPPPVATQQAEAKHRQGEIMFTPQHGENCWKRRFDNLDGKIVSDRIVECPGEVAPKRTLPQRRDNTVRIRAIMDDFKQRK
jgi:hypothetical protein